ncbi:FGGY-family carbohydrate kinase [Nocardioides sp. KC13]|uniref:FGGY-family carbohydrate kinase n=1 Tax=Nocardioides turkmenicus TaxID=2711220 RepID=A0A6M1R5G8_9ACTN|nr:FGGY-family carbohydrate kinase [Nocardioides sp. KC13]NGN93941.1 FGGY-family carbohydrate kinase [Nocardioides sp. KC13]
MAALVVGVDVGTGSSKGVLATAEGVVIAKTMRRHQMSLPRAGYAEMDAETIWWDEVVSICRELALHARGHMIAGICVSGIGPCVLVTDDDLTPLRPGILYGIDSRASAEIEELTERFGAEAILDRAGSALSSQAVGPKLLWLRRHEPDVWARTRRWFGSSSYVVARLTGEYILDHHTASQCAPLYDLAAQDWATDWVEEIVGDLRMPRLAWSGEVVGTLRADAAAATGLPVGTPVMAGSVDAWTEAFSCGVRQPGDLMLMYGSTMFFVQIGRDLKACPPLWTAQSVQPDVMTLAGGMATSGSLLSWVQELTGKVDIATVAEEAELTPPGAEGLVVLPYFAGERTPLFDPHARGVVAGLSLRHGRGHLYRAVYEGIAYGVRQILELLEVAGGPASRVVTVGGGTRSGPWSQIVSDVTGIRQLVPEQTIGASYGDALLAAIGSGLVPPDTDWTRIVGEIVPSPENRAVYDELYGTFTELYPATRDQVHHLARIQEALTRT